MFTRCRLATILIGFAVTLVASDVSASIAMSLDGSASSSARILETITGTGTDTNESPSKVPSYLDELRRLALAAQAGLLSPGTSNGMTGGNTGSSGGQSASAICSIAGNSISDVNPSGWVVGEHRASLPLLPCNCLLRPPQVV
jgi:hypothetical protein